MYNQPKDAVRQYIRSGHLTAAVVRPEHDAEKWIAVDAGNISDLD